MFCVHIFLPNRCWTWVWRGATLSAGSVCGRSVDPLHPRPPSPSDFNHFLLIQAIVFLIPDTWVDASGKLRHAVRARARSLARSPVLFLGSMSGMEIWRVGSIQPLRLRLIQAAQNPFSLRYSWNRLFCLLFYQSVSNLARLSRPASSRPAGILLTNHRT